MMAQAGRVVSKPELLRLIWGADGAENPRRLRIAVSLLRRIIGSGPDRPRLETVPKVGYRLAIRNSFVSFSSSGETSVSMS